MYTVLTDPSPPYFFPLESLYKTLDTCVKLKMLLLNFGEDGHCTRISLMLRSILRPLSQTWKCH